MNGSPSTSCARVPRHEPRRAMSAERGAAMRHLQGAAVPRPSDRARQGELRPAHRVERLPVVVDFWAPWCGPCRMMAPAYEQAAERLASDVRIAKLNTEDAPDIAGRFGIRGIPTMIAFPAAAKLPGNRAQWISPAFSGGSKPTSDGLFTLCLQSALRVKTALREAQNAAGSGTRKGFATKRRAVFAATRRERAPWGATLRCSPRRDARSLLRRAP